MPVKKDGYKGAFANIPIRLNRPGYAWPYIWGLLPLCFVAYYKQPRDYFMMMYWVSSNDITQTMAHIFILYRLNEKYNWITDTWRRTIYWFIWHVGITSALYFLLGIFNFYICYGKPPEEAIQLLLDAWMESNH